MTAWTDAVKKTFHMNRKTNKNYQFKDALMDAKKIYNKGAGVVTDVAVQGSDMVMKIARKGSRTARKTAKSVKRAVMGRKGNKSAKGKRKSASRRK